MGGEKRGCWFCDRGGGGGVELWQEGAAEKIFSQVESDRGL